MRDHPPKSSKSTKSDGKIVARGNLREHPGHPKRLQSVSNISILHKYFAHGFQKASRPVLWPKPAQKYMSETVFGLRRRERIACWPFYEKLVRRAHVSKDFGVALGSKSRHLGHFGFTMALFSPLGAQSLSGLWKLPEISRDLNHAGGQSLSKRQVI